MALPVSPELVLLDEKLLAKLQEAGQLTPEYLNKRFLESSVRYYVAPSDPRRPYTLRPQPEQVRSGCSQCIQAGWRVYTCLRLPYTAI